MRITHSVAINGSGIIALIMSTTLSNFGGNLLETFLRVDFSPKKRTCFFNVKRSNCHILAMVGPIDTEGEGCASVHYIYITSSTM